MRREHMERNVRFYKRKYGRINQPLKFKHMEFLIIILIVFTLVAVAAIVDATRTRKQNKDLVQSLDECKKNNKDYLNKCLELDNENERLKFLLKQNSNFKKWTVKPLHLKKCPPCQTMNS